MAENVCGLGCGGLGQKRRLTQTTKTSGKRNGSGGLGDLLLFKIQAATSCWEFRMRQGRMEPRGSGASQVGQRSWSSSLEILCWFCLLPFCWWVPRDADAAQLFFFLPISTGAIYVQVLYSFYCLRQRYEWRRHAEVRGQTDKIFTPWQALVIHA